MRDAAASDGHLVGGRSTHKRYARMDTPFGLAEVEIGVAEETAKNRYGEASTVLTFVV